MELEIKRLSVNNLNDYLHFFEPDAHASPTGCEFCYCVSYAAIANAHIDFSAEEVRRQYAIAYASCGILQGFLAFGDEHMIGWCNANSKTLSTECAGWKWMFPDGCPTPEDGVMSVFCFAVAPEYRRQGIAASLLDRVIAESRQDGYRIVEAYPQKAPAGDADEYPGPLHLYEKRGFTIVGETPERYIVQKEL